MGMINSFVCMWLNNICALNIVKIEKQIIDWDVLAVNITNETRG